MTRHHLVFALAAILITLTAVTAVVQGQSGDYKIGVLEPLTGPLCGAASEAAARQNVIYWETSCVDPRFNKRGLKNVYRTEIDATGFGWYNVEFIAKHLAPRFGKKPGELKVAFLSEDSSYGQGVT